MTIKPRPIPTGPEITFDEIAVGDVITVSFANAGRQYYRYGRVGYISESGVVRQAGPEKYPNTGELLIAKSQFNSRYDYDIHVYRGLPLVPEPRGYGAVVRARVPFMPEGTFTFLMRTRNIDPRTFINDQVWMQLDSRSGKPYMYAWEKLEVWEVVSTGTAPERIGLGSAI